MWIVNVANKQMNDKFFKILIINHQLGQDFHFNWNSVPFLFYFFHYFYSHHSQFIHNAIETRECMAQIWIEKFPIKPVVYKTFQMTFWKEKRYQIMIWKIIEVFTIFAKVDKKKYTLNNQQMIHKQWQRLRQWL